MIPELPIKSALGDYSVQFFRNPLESKTLLNSYKPSHFIVDRIVYGLHKEIIDLLAENRPLFLMDATEEMKSLDGMQLFATWLQSQGANRSSVLVAIGGGITQDLAAFTAHNYYRGISWIFFPTTLLAMCDSCIGAKCGLNLNDFKNQLGCFQAPRAIFTCSDFLQTLPDFHIASGYGEILKLHLTGGDWGLIADLESSLQQGLRNDSLLEVIFKSLQIKKTIIEIDEFEKDLRRTLNYGHSFGHALEAVTNHVVPHGLAVAWGIDLINWIAFQRSILDERHYKTVQSFIKKFLPHKLNQKISTAELIQAAKKDKKTEPSGINLIFLNNHCSLEIRKIPFDQALADQVSSYLEGQNIYG